MSYLPIARKYRPKTFEDLIGQPHVTTTLIRAIESGRIAQAYLFTGQRGVGKTSAARILAKALNCAKGPTPTPCQECASCQAILHGTSLDVIEIDGASNRGIDDIRQLREQVKFSPVHGSFRVYIIDEVHQITSDAFNALLKTLEEPPAHAKFIFATTAPNKVPPTILSRCQRFDFRRLPGATVVSQLHKIAAAEQITAEESALYAIAAASEGSLRDAEVVFEQLISFASGTITEQDVNQLLGNLEQDALLRWTQMLLDRDAKGALLLLNEQLERGKDVVQLLTGLITHFRNLMIVRTAEAVASAPDVVAPMVELPVERIKRLIEQAAPYSAEELLLMGQVLAGAYEWIRRSPFAQAILEFALIRIATREAWASLEQITQRLEQLSQADTAVPGTSAPKSAPATRPPTTPARSVGAVPGSMPAPQPETSAASHAPQGPVDSLEAVVTRWPRVIERLGKQKMSLAAYLMEARPMELAGEVLRIGLPGLTPLHQDVLNTSEHLRLVERTLGEVCAKPLRPQYAALPPGSGSGTPGVSGYIDPSGLDAPVAPVPPIVKEIVSLFDATIVPQPPKPSA